MKMKQINRIAWVDNCKGLATILVVLCHCQTDHYLDFGLNQLFSDWFSYFHVSLFFLVAGYVLAMKPNKDSFVMFLAKKIKRLLVPFWCFSLAYWLEQALFKAVSGREWVSYLLSNLINLVNGQGGGVLWFLSCLFIAEVIFFFMCKIKKKWIMAIFALGTTLIGFYCVPLYAVLRRSLIAVGFLTAGYFFRLYEPQKLVARVISLIVGVMANVIGMLFNGGVGLAGLVWGKNEIVYFVLSCFSSIAIMEIFMLIKKPVPILSYFGRESMTIYCIHMPIIELLWMINNQFLSWTWLEGAIMAAVTLVICVPVVIILNKWFPWMIGTKKR